MNILEKVDKISIAIGVEDEVYFITIPKGTEMLAVHMLAGLSEDGKLHVTKGSKDYQFMEVERDKE